MPIEIIDSSVAAAVAAAEVGADGTRELGVVQALRAPWGDAAVTVEVKDAAGVLLGVSTWGAWWIDSVAGTTSLRNGAETAWTFTNPGAPARMVFKDGATEVFSASASVGGSGVRFGYAIAADVPLSWGDITFSAADLDSATVPEWTATPSGSQYLRVGSEIDLSDNIVGTYALMAYSAVPEGVEVLADAISASDDATAGDYQVLLGPDDFGYRLKPDDSDGYDYAGGSSNLIGGVSWRYYNAATLTEWSAAGGTWRDERGFDQSTTSGYDVNIVDDNTSKSVKFDVTWIVNRWARNPRDNFGIVLVGVSNGTIQVGTRQTGQPAQLVITYAVGSPVTYSVDVDALLSPTGISPTGAVAAASTVSSGTNGARTYLFFDLPDSAYVGTITDATLTITCPGQFATSGASPITVAAMRVTDPRQPQGLPAEASGKTLTWAAGSYSGSDSSILFGTQFPGAVPAGSNPAWVSSFTNVSAHAWARAWTIDQTHTSYGITLPGTSQYALMFTFPPGANLGNDLVYPFSASYPFARSSNSWTGRDSAFVHYRVCFGTDSHWSDAGKLIGFHGKLDYCGATVSGAPTDGNGGSPASSFGWSARGLLTPTAHGLTDEVVRAGGYYAYHQDQATVYGDVWSSGNCIAGAFVAGRWYDVDMELRINTAGVSNGVARMWVDDFLVFEDTSVQWRPVGVDSRLVHPSLSGSAYDLNIAGVWIVPEYGGTGTIPTGEGGHIAITDFVVSTERVGKQT